MPPLAADISTGRVTVKRFLILLLIVAGIAAWGEGKAEVAKSGTTPKA